MKVTEAHPDRLVIEDRPWLLWIVLPLLGSLTLAAALTGQAGGGPAMLVAVALGGGMFWVLWRFAPFQRFTFDRQAGLFTHDVHRLTGRQTWSRPLAQIRRAADEGDWSDGSRLERITLLTTDGRHPMEAGYSSASRAPLIRVINNWLGVNGGAG